VVLIWFFHSVRLLAMLSVTLIAGTLAAFGAAALTVGHLNVATAFLGAIIAGNGVNYGILLIARLRHEEHQADRAAAIARAIECTLRPTLIASLGASIAYGSLAATSFRGFADFALIGGVGMILCWIASYTLLPVLLLRWHVRRPARRPALGETLVRMLAGRRSTVVCAVAAIAIALAGWLSYRYIAHDPFEYDMKKLRSAGSEARAARRWVKLADDTFGRGIAGQTYIAVDRLEQVSLVVAALRDADPHEHTIGTIRSILDVVPERQADKLAVLAELRTLLDDPVLEQLAEADKTELRAWRPPAGLAPITIDGLPAELAGRLREQNGRVGLLIGVRPATTLDEWDGRDLIRFANAVRRIDLRDGETVTTSGTHVIYADIIASLRGDGPRVIAVAAVCLIVMVMVVGGRNRRSLVVLVATGTGSLLLVGVCALIDLKVTFLDFVALPITLGLGVDYAINMADQPDASDIAATLRTSGAAVFVCSLTTIIGYGSLLVSDNRAIQAFGLASLIGELCCVATALTLVPALLSLGQRRRL
jgi:uncharacterized protein